MKKISLTLLALGLMLAFNTADAQRYGRNSGSDDTRVERRGNRGNTGYNDGARRGGRSYGNNNSRRGGRSGGYHSNEYRGRGYAAPRRVIRGRSGATCGTRGFRANRTWIDNGRRCRIVNSSCGTFYWDIIERPFWVEGHYTYRNGCRRWVRGFNDYRVVRRVKYYY